MCEVMLQSLCILPCAIFGVPLAFGRKVGFAIFFAPFAVLLGDAIWVSLSVSTRASAPYLRMSELILPMIVGIFSFPFAKVCEALGALLRAFAGSRFAHLRKTSFPEFRTCGLGRLPLLVCPRHVAT